MKDEYDIFQEEGPYYQLNQKNQHKKEEEVLFKVPGEAQIINQTNNKSPQIQQSNNKTDSAQDHRNQTDTQIFQQYTRKWKTEHDVKLNGHKIKNGKFSDDEIALLKQAIFRYVDENQLGTDGLIKLVSQKHKGVIKGAWTTIAKVLPDRSVLSCYKIIRRKLNPLNYQGKWREEEEKKLVQLIEIHGRKWGTIAKELQRTAENVRDKYKQMGEQNYQYRQSEWLVGEVVDLFRLVERFTGLVLLKQKAEQLTYEQKMEPLPSLRYLNPKRSGKVLEIDDKINNLRQIINFEKCKQCQEIPWSSISNILKTKSKDDCRNIWLQIIRNNYSSNEFNFREVVKLLQGAKDQFPEKIEQINFTEIKNGRSQEENELQLKILLKTANAQKQKLIAALEDLINYTKKSHTVHYNVPKNPFQDFVEEFQGRT